MDAGRGWEQGALQNTGNPLDVAIQGEGFLRIKLPDGRQALTRDGNLQVDGLGRLTSNTGALIQPPVTIPKGTPQDKIAIGGDGTVTADGRRVGKLALVSVRSPQSLTPVGDNAFLPSAASGAPGPAPRATRLTQGALEASNVDMASAMVAMIESQRAFELVSKAIHTADQMWEIANGVKR